MARVVQESEVPQKQREQYPWDTWLDGQWWELSQGEDFTASVNAIKAGAFFAARRRDMKATVRVISETTIQIKGIRLCLSSTGSISPEPCA